MIYKLPDGRITSDPEEFERFMDAAVPVPEEYSEEPSELLEEIVAEDEVEVTVESGSETVEVQVSRARKK